LSFCSCIFLNVSHRSRGVYPHRTLFSGTWGRIRYGTCNSTSCAQGYDYCYFSIEFLWFFCLQLADRISIVAKGFLVCRGWNARRLKAYAATHKNGTPFYVQLNTPLEKMSICIGILAFYYPQKTTSVKRPLGAFYSSKRPVSKLEYFDFCSQNSFIEQSFKF